MELRTIRAFVAVVEQGGFSRAARVLFASQPTVSKAVKQLEEELGVALLARPGRGVAVTEAGEAVLRRGRAMLAEAEDLQRELDELRGLKRGSLRLGLPLFGSSILFAPLFAAFRSRWPGVDIGLEEHGSKRLEALLLAGRTDLAAVLAPDPAKFQWQAVRTEPLVALLPAGHRLAGRARVDLGDLAAEPLVLYEQGFALNQILQEACRRRGFAPTVAARSGQDDFILELVAAGVGVGFFPRIVAERQPHPGVRAVLLDEPRTEWRIVFAWRRGGYLSQAARAWLALAREMHPEAAGDGALSGN
ncbi:MAG: LysR family transcriptional regulator [Desulfovibrionaceae bacterium]